MGLLLCEYSSVAMPSLSDAIAAAARTLAPVSVTPRLDAELLMAQALGVSRDALLLAGPAGAVPAAFAALVERRLGGEPIAYIIGTRGFWTIELAVTPAVLIPRADSETLIAAAVAHFQGGPGPGTILDLGTGSGALLLAALDEWPEASGIGVDRSAAALEVAHGNAMRLGLGPRARFVRGDWAAALEAQFDLVLCNPPYVEADAQLAADVLREPHEALFAGPDGLDDYHRLARQVGRLIAAGGIACVEIGSGQAEAVAALFTAARLSVSVVRDYGDRDRCLVLAPD